MERKPIVCATRGGKASRRTQERAIALAKERDADLIFLYIADPSFAGPVCDVLATAVEDELKRLGRSLLSIAQARAQEHGVRARTVVRAGPVWETIKAYLSEVGAGALVLGTPGDEVDKAADVGDVNRLAEEVRRDTGVEVVVV
ncbi:MAG TPA: universal stress protein [Anaerolineales bacterium]|nr:universal stress protein [Anaerolineae bacterium]HIP87532.1 universal stress protein [Anaerolineales bacterium]